VANIRDIEDVQVNFDGITYAKGGSVLKQLVAWVGEEAFFAGVHNYFIKHQWGNATLQDLLSELEYTSGRKLRQWSTVWLETAGVNTLYPDVSVDTSGVITGFSIRQTAPEEWPTLRPHRLAVGFYNPAEDGTFHRVWRGELDIEGATSEVSEARGLPRPELILINDDDLAYAKIRLDEHSRATAIDGLSRVQDPLARALIWGSLWDSTRDAETPPREFIDLVLRNIGRETESTTIRTALGQLALVARNYCDPTHRAQTVAEVGDQVWNLATEAGAGSDAQFQLVKAFATLASTTAHANTLRSLRDGDIALTGLSIDTDLSWELLGGLALCGATTGADIDAALAADNTSNGQQAAARVRSLLPGTSDKKAVFDQLVSSSDTPNAIVRSLTLGYDLVNDPTSLEPLVEDYFSMLETMWNSRTYKIAEYLAEGLYPGSLVSEKLVQLSQDWLDSHPDIPALRRIVQENMAGVERALRVQALDRSIART
jgi:aminopeptidase N